MELKPASKQTEIGILPKEWEVRTVGEVFRLINGRAFKPEDWKTNGTPIIRIQNLNDPDAWFNYSTAQVEDRHRVVPGDLLFAWSGTTGTSFGARVWRGPPGILNQHIFRVVTDELKLRPEFSFVVLQRIQHSIEKQAHGFKASFVHVKKSDLVKVKLPLPPLPEQHAIAAALSDVDALLGGLDRLIAKKRDLKQAAMQQLLTGQTRLPGFSGKWTTTTLGEIGECLIGLTYRPEDVVDHGMLVLRSSNIQNSRFTFNDNVYVKVAIPERLILRENDIVVCVRNGSRALIGKCALVGPEVVGHTFGAFMSIYRSRFNPFLLHVFQSDAIQLQIRENIGATINQITNKDMRGFRVRLPPDAEQRAIGDVLSDMDAELTALEARRDKTRLLKQGMMQELLTGRIRLI